MIKQMKGVNTENVIFIIQLVLYIPLKLYYIDKVSQMSQNKCLSRKWKDSSLLLPL